MCSHMKNLIFVRYDKFSVYNGICSSPYNDEESLKKQYNISISFFMINRLKIKKMIQ